MNSSPDQTLASSTPLEALVDQALGHIENQKWNPARECLEQAVSLAPGLAQLHGALGMVFFRLENLPAAAAAYAAAADLTPEDPDQWTQLAMVRLQLGQPPEAETALQRSLSLRPDDSATLKLLGECLRDQGRHWEAARTFTRLIDRNFDQTAIGLALAQCYDAVGEWAGCQAALQLVLQRDPANAVALEGLAALSGKVRATPRPPRRADSVLTVEVCCPSLNRLKEVIRLRNSLPEDCLFTPSLETQPRALTQIVNELFFKSTGDIVIMAADHLEFKPSCLEVIQECFAREFPDLDGVVGLNICNLPHTTGISEYCFLALGRKFIERFQVKGQYQGVFCPEYYHFYGDTEFGIFAEKIGKFHYDERAAVFTWHPNAGNASRDQTYSASRSRKGFDDTMWRHRQKAKLLWGETFEKIGAIPAETPVASQAPASVPVPEKMRAPFGARHAEKVLGLLRVATRILAWGTAEARDWLAQNLPAGAELTHCEAGAEPDPARTGGTGKKFDFILIDGDAPAAALAAADEILLSTGMVVLHDSQRVRHDEGKKAFVAHGHLGSCPDHPGAQLWWGARNELAGDPRASGGLPLIICFYTKNTDYEKVARKLIASCERNHLEHRVVGLESRGSWEANCSLKAEFVHETWKSCGRPVLWVDADAILDRPPNLLRGVTADFAIHRCRDWEFASGTLFFNQTPAAGALLDRWLARCRRFPQVWDQVNLDLAWEETIAVHPLETLWLPEPYCRIFDLHEGRSAAAGVVEHFQASRELKAKVSTRPNVPLARATDALKAARRACRNRDWQLSRADAALAVGRSAASLPEAMADAVVTLQATPGKVLCLTGGPGVLWRLLAERGHEVHGLAGNSDQVLAADQRSGGSRIQTGLVTALPYAAASFDAVVCAGQLELLEEAGLDSALGEMKRVAKGGILLVVQTRPDAEDRWPDHADQASWWQTKLAAAGFGSVPLPGLGNGTVAYALNTVSIAVPEAQPAGADSVDGTTDQAAATILVLTHDPKHPLYASWLGQTRHRVVYGTNTGLDFVFPENVGLVIAADCYQEPRASLLARAVERGIPTLLLADGILEYRNTFEHPQIAPGAIFQPVSTHKIACLGRSQARVLESWGNGTQCEITGSARFDRYATLHRRVRAAGEPFRVLVMTALTPYFTPAQHERIRQSLVDLRQFFTTHPLLAGMPLQVEWRITKGLELEIGVETVLSDLSGRELAEVLQKVDAVISTPSTSMVEAMLLGLPVAVLDYTNSPHYLQPAWRITAAEQVLPVVTELIAPPAPKLLFQEAALHDTLECTTLAAPRLLRLADTMIRHGTQARANGLPLVFPPRLLPVGTADPAPAEQRFKAADLHPGHAQFHEQHLQRLQVEVGQLRAYAAQLEQQSRQTGEMARLKTYAELTIQWRSKLEAAVVLSGLKQTKAAVDLMIQSLRTVETCRLPEVTLEALLEVSSHLARHDPGKTRVLLEAALNLAQQTQKTEAVQRAAQMLEKLPGGKPQKRQHAA